MSLCACFLVPGLLGQGEEDHGELLLGDLAVAVEVAALHDGVLEVDEVGRVVVLLHQLEEVLQEAAQLLVLDRAVAVLKSFDDLISIAHCSS